MRLQSFTAPDTREAMAKLRASLGADAIIVASERLKGGGVRITGAVTGEDLDLAELLAPPAADREDPRLAALAAHHELPEPLWRRLAAAAQTCGSADPTIVLSHALGSVFRFAPLPLQAPRVLLLAGPPGMGKTATTAKLAARAVLEGGRVAVITADVGRAGGIEQLTTLLAPLGLRPERAADPDALRHAVAAARADAILIDSPGFNPFKPADLGALSDLLEASRAEPILVLAAGLGVADSAEVAQTYAALGCTRLLATKLDTARRLGGMLAAAAAGLAFSEAGIGPTIGEGLRPLSPGGLARLLLRRHELAVGRSAAAPPQRRAAAG